MPSPVGLARRVRAGDRDAVADDDDLAPADALGEGAVLERDRRRRGDAAWRARPRTRRRGASSAGRRHPAASARPAAVSDGATAAPSTASARSPASVPQARLPLRLELRRRERRRRRRASSRCCSWNAGISARSMTTSSEMRSGATRIAAKWLIVKLPSGWAATAAGATAATAAATAASSAASRARRRAPPRDRSRRAAPGGTSRAGPEQPAGFIGATPAIRGAGGGQRVERAADGQRLLEQVPRPRRDRRARGRSRPRGTGASRRGSRARAPSSSRRPRRRRGRSRAAPRRSAS